jgi:CDP-diglyceride synthetase
MPCYTGEENGVTPIMVITAVESAFGFILSSLILYLILKQRRKLYHYLFAAFLLICAVWDLGVCLLMIRNDHLNELQLIGYIITLMVSFIPSLLFHFSNLYTGKPVKWAILLGWVLTGVLWLATILGLVNKIEGVYTYHWGNIHRYAPSVLDPLIMVIWFGFNLGACWLLYKGIKRARSDVERRHYLYITSGVLVITFAIVKVGVALGIDLPFLLPLGMFLIDIFNAIIGIAIIKDKLFDITVIIKKGTVFSLLAALLAFIYSFIEHILVTYVGEKVGEDSVILHLIAVGIGIAVLMPVKSRLEKGVEGYFAHRKLEF